MDTSSTDSSMLRELRKSRRYEFYSKVQCTRCVQNGTAEDYKEPLELNLINISSGGLGVITEKNFDKGALLLLNLMLEEENYEKISARVMWTIKTGTTYRHGLEISNISGKLYSHLSKLDNSVTARV